MVEFGDRIYISNVCILYILMVVFGDRIYISNVCIYTHTDGSIW